MQCSNDYYFNTMFLRFNINACLFDSLNDCFIRISSRQDKEFNKYDQDMNYMSNVEEDESSANVLKQNDSGTIDNYIITQTCHRIAALFDEHI